jgi:precorrin-2/cobalt-factor-2 C20-methyltransferase
MSGKLYALSTGPGAADLITVRAARILGQLDVLYAPAGRKGGDSLALSIVREYLGEQTEVRCCHFPMSADSAEKEAVWDEVAAALAQEVAAGRQVGFITLGDAMLFSTWVFCCSGLAARTGWRLSLALPLSPPLPRGRKRRWPWSSSRWR